MPRIRNPRAIARQYQLDQARARQAQQLAEQIKRQAELEEAGEVQDTPAQQQQGWRRTPPPGNQGRPRNPRNYAWELPDGIHYDLKGVPFKTQGGKIVRMSDEELEQALEAGRLRQEQHKNVNKTREDIAKQERQTARRKEWTEKARASDEFRRLQRRNIDVLNATRRAIAQGVRPDVAREEAINEAARLERSRAEGANAPAAAPRAGGPGVQQSIEERPRTPRPRAPRRGEEVPTQTPEPEVPVNQPVERGMNDPRAAQEDAFFNAVRAEIPAQDDLVDMDTADMFARVSELMEDVNQFVSEGRLTEQRGQALLNEFIQRVEDAGRSADLDQALRMVEEGDDGLRQQMTIENLSREELGRPPVEFKEALYQRLKDERDLISVTRYIQENVPDSSYKLIASRVADRLEFLRDTQGLEFNFRIIDQGSKAPMEVTVPFSNSSEQGGTRGMVRPTNTGEDVYINGLYDRLGVNYTTILHEAVHAATTSAIRYGKSKGVDNPQIRAATKGLNETFNAVVRQFNEKARRYKDGDLEAFNELELRLFKGAQNSLNNTDELVAWGLTDKEFQKYLETIQIGNETAWSAFVRIVRQFLGLDPKQNTALSEVLRYTDDILRSREDIREAVTTRSRVSVEGQFKLEDGIYQDEAGNLFQVKGSDITKVQ